mmetsp:Transcript_12296/g.28389  ORF Transcript_12296/g.28389 Transcript_12296/m.28389 type:complete len:286 (-) Transcript_12296:586-1443(-)
MPQLHHVDVRSLHILGHVGQLLLDVSGGHSVLVLVLLARQQLPRQLLVLLSRLAPRPCAGYRHRLDDIMRDLEERLGAASKEGRTSCWLQAEEIALMRLELEQQIHRLHFRGEFNKEVSRQHNLPQFRPLLKLVQRLFDGLLPVLVARPIPHRRGFRQVSLLAQHDIHLLHCTDCLYQRLHPVPILPPPHVHSDYELIGNRASMAPDLPHALHRALRAGTGRVEDFDLRQDKVVSAKLLPLLPYPCPSVKSRPAVVSEARRSALRQEVFLQIAISTHKVRCSHTR